VSGNTGDVSVPLKDYVDEKVASIYRAMELAQAATKESTKIAYESMDKRLQSMNASLPRAEFLAWSEGVTSDLRLLRESKAKLEGKASQLSVSISLMLGLAGLFIGIIGILLTVFRH